MKIQREDKIKTQEGKGRCDQKHTVSKRPAKTLSAVAATLPPVRCKSHSAVRRSTCGNICCILSAAASRAARAWGPSLCLPPAADEEEEPAAPGAELGEKKK